MAAARIAPVTRGPQKYSFVPQKPAITQYSPNPFTRDQLDFFFSNIASVELRKRIVDGVLNAPSLDQAIAGMLLQQGALWSGFNTTPPLPEPDLIVALAAPAPGQIASGKPAGGSGGGGASRKNGPFKVLV